MENQIALAVLTTMICEGLTVVRSEDGKDECTASVEAIFSVLFKHFPSEFLSANKDVMNLIEQGKL